MKHIINIGLAVPNSSDMIDTETALAALVDVFGSVARWCTARSGSEDTLVAEVLVAHSHAYALGAQLSQALSQDCIAVYCPQRHTGALVGPSAGKWGDFKLELLLTMAD